jgi:hypothetical protein
VVWPGLVVGLPVELTLEDAVGTRGAHLRVPGLAAGERRSVRLQLAREARALAGHCVDAAGKPVAGARVRLHVPQARSAEAIAAPDGGFASPPLLAERVNLRVSAEGFASRALEDVACTPNLRLVLERGRSLRVELRDPSGVPIAVGEVRARADGTTWTPTRAETARHDFTDVADAGLELEHTWHARTHRTQVPDGADAFAWVLPELGRLEVEVAAFEIGELESGYVVLEARDGRGGVEQRFLERGAAPWALRFDPWPGDYSLRRVVHTYTADADGWRTFAGAREVGGPVEVEVPAGRVVQAALEGAP